MIISFAVGVEKPLCISLSLCNIPLMLYTQMLISESSNKLTQLGYENGSAIENLAELGPIVLEQFGKGRRRCRYRKVDKPDGTLSVPRQDSFISPYKRFRELF